MARYLIDANLPRWFSLWSGSDYAFVHDLGAGWTDTQIWHHASISGLTIVSKDADFSARVMVTASGPHVIHIRVGNLVMRDFHALLSGIWDDVCRLSATSRLVAVFKDRIEIIG